MIFIILRSFLSYINIADDGSITKISDDNTLKVTDVLIKVNLAGAPDIGLSGPNGDVYNAPFSADDPFYYLIMDNTGGAITDSAAAAMDLTLDADTVLLVGIAPETAILIPRDAQGYKGCAQDGQDNNKCPQAQAAADAAN